MRRPSARAGPHQFRVSQSAYDALVPGRRYTVYFTPRTDILLRIAPLSDDDHDGGEPSSAPAERPPAA